jgi:hypothetical protein
VSPVCYCKVGTVGDEFGLLAFAAEMGERWKQGEDGSSFRGLAEEFNMLVLERAMREQDMNPLDGEVRNIYRLLTDDDVSSGDTIEARNRLDHNGIDASDLVSNFISYQTVNRHIKDCLGTESPPEVTGTDSARKTIHRIQALRNRTEAVTKESLKQFEDSDTLPYDDFDVIVNINVVDNNSGELQKLDRLIEDIKDI